MRIGNSTVREQQGERIDGGRRAFLRGHFTPETTQAEIRPPWAAPQFLQLCTHCGDCLQQCDKSLIVLDNHGYPALDFQRGGCNFCGACANSCRSGALHYLPADSPWNSWAEIDHRCLATNGITCRSCGELCDSRAIRFQAAIGGRSRVTVELQRCSGCGSCVATCPVAAIAITTEPNR
ncbi:MAG: ferredoxin-type protein NapF [Gammaproteobacteria bacterium]|nr:ferredoxin-type protein NapF [Gammaproteobacteria bacterium]